MTQEEMLRLLVKIQEYCSKMSCHKCVFRAEDKSRKCVLHNPPEAWDLSKIEYNIRIGE